MATMAAILNFCIGYHGNSGHLSDDCYYTNKACAYS